MRNGVEFYCALGEAVNGPRGYFGSNLDALADCLSSSYGHGQLSVVVWRNSANSLTLLGELFLESVIDIMREFDVDVRLC